MGDFVVEKTPHPSTGDQQLEAISVICEFERLNDYFTVGRNRSGEMIKFGNINAYVNFHEVVPPFPKV